MADAERTDPFVEVANRQLYRAHTYDNLEFLPQLRGRQASEIYREMAENDALIGAVLFAIEMILRRVEWEVEPFSPSTYDVGRADFLNECKEDMSMSWEDVICDALTMLAYGHAYMEIVYKHRTTADLTAPAEHRTRYPDGRIGWRKFVLLPQPTIVDWELDEHGGVQACTQGGVYGLERVTVPIEKALLFRTNTRTPRGRSILRTVIESWYYRKRIRQVEGIGIDRDLAGLPVFYLDKSIMENASRRAEYQDIVRNLRRDEQEGVLLPAMKTPDGALEPIAKLELLSSGQSRRQFDIGAVIARYNREITMAVLQDIVLLGHETVGTQALASEKRDLSDTALQAWLNNIAAVFNAHAIPRLFALNGESLENLPKLVPGELRPTDVNEFATAIRDIAAGGFPFTGDPDVEAEVRRRLGLPAMLPEDQRPTDEPVPEGPDAQPDVEE